MEIDSSKRSRADTPLEGVIVCLTGLTHDVKNQLHEMIESLGGRYTRDLSIDKNTHLVANVAQGAKYDLAKDSHISVVKPSWLLACSKMGTRVDEVPHLLNPETSGEATIHAGTDAISLQIDLLLSDETMFCCVFKNCRFYLLGFEDHADFKKTLGKLIRRGMGTIYWELNEEITTLVLHENCDTSLRKAAKVVTECHLNLPSAVSPAWVIDSYKAGCLLSEPKYPPSEPLQSLKLTPAASSKPPRKLFHKMNSNSTVFRGCLFSLSRVAPPPWAVDFESKEQEALIKSHSGQMLSLKLLDAIRIDAGSGGLRRQCYVVCWGGRHQLHLNPFLSELQRKDLCTLVEVTPMWLKACVAAQKRLRVDTLPLALTPQPWPLRRLDSSISIVLSGFSSTQKLAITKLIEAVGGRITGDMTKSNTHLICHEGSSSPKLAKASQWGIHIVTLEWLKHVIEHGLVGQHKDEGGCEFRFPLETSRT